jgi:hypothetical protein
MCRRRSYYDPELGSGSAIWHADSQSPAAAFPSLFSLKDLPSDVGFFISVAAQDPKFNINATRQFLDSIGSNHTEIVEAT